MANIYSHFTLARKCLETMPEELKKTVERNFDIYLIGSVGLDFYFYYRLPFSRKMFHYASDVHRVSFAHYADLFHRNLIKTDDRDKVTAYICGFLTHYLLDNHVHSYVEKKIQVSGITHALIESQFDSYLLRKDGIRPSTCYLWKDINNTDENVRIIWQLFDDFSLEMYRGFWRWGKSIYRFTRTGLPVYGSLLKGAIKLLKVKQNFTDQLYADEEDPRCADSNLRLEKLLQKAHGEFVRCGPQVIDDIISGKKLPSRFDQDFAAQKGWEEEPVLDYEKEKEYVLK
ncbi:MAG: zinc dependent phospholipase C family protein [Erysipelotrichaceae bacterium]|nr:zinc dependent phospholipase C family protein [Erysipelotrichaceae bacterium]